MRRTLSIAAVAATMIVAAPVAQADDSLHANAVCNGKWVVVTVDASADAIVGYTYGGKTVVGGPKMVPDIGGGNPTGDYGIAMVIEVRDSIDAATHRVLRSTRIVTPDCTGVERTTTTTTTTTTTRPTVGIAVDGAAHAAKLA